MNANGYVYPFLVANANANAPTNAGGMPVTEAVAPNPPIALAGAQQGGLGGMANPYLGGGNFGGGGVPYGHIQAGAQQGGQGGVTNPYLAAGNLGGGAVPYGHVQAGAQQ